MWCGAGVVGTAAAIAVMTGGVVAAEGVAAMGGVAGAGGVAAAGMADTAGAANAAATQGASWVEGVRGVLGWVPAVVFPTASLVQLVVLLRARSGAGVSALTWALFAFANLCLFAYMENRGEVQALATTLGTAVIQVAIVMLALRWRKRPAVS